MGKHITGPAVRSDMIAAAKIFADDLESHPSMGNRIDGHSMRQEMNDFSAALSENIDSISDADVQKEGEAFLAIQHGNFVEDAAVDKRALQEAKTAAQDAMNRIKKGMMYGEDMGSSAMVCYQDGIANLERALAILKKAGAKP